MYRRWRRAGGTAAAPLSAVANLFTHLTSPKAPRLHAADEAYCAQVGFRVFDDKPGADVPALARAAEAGDVAALLRGLV